MIKDAGAILLFLVIGIIVFAGYQMSGGNLLFFLIIGPSIYFAHFLKTFAMTTLGFSPLIGTLPASAVNDYVFLLPATLLYFGMIGFQIHQLLKEQGPIRHFSFLALLAFLGYIHYKAWTSLTGYLVAG
jgi:hypothetical protein